MTKKDRFQLFISDTPVDEEHFHQDIELLYILEGSVDITVEKKVSHLHPDDIYVVNANHRHSFRTAEGNVLMLRLLISHQLVSENNPNGEVLFWCDSSVTDSDKYARLRRVLRQMLQHYVENRDYTVSYGYLADCYAVLEYLTVHFMLRPGDIHRSEDVDRYEERIRQINHYIYSNYDQPISMKELSEKLFLSNGYLSRFFKKNYGMSFAGYLTSVRIFHAADDLLYTDEPITRIAYNNGFASAALFNKVFKKTYQQTPSEFRRQRAKKEKQDNRQHQEELEKRLERMLEAEQYEGAGEFQEKKEIFGECSVGLYDVLKNNWGDTINFGDASALLHSSIREHLRTLHESLNFRYARFWGLFIEDFFIRPDQEHYNFSQIDSVLDFILELGMKPHIELGLKPRTIYYGIGCGRNEYLDQATMDDFTPAHWEKLMHAFMRHLSHHYGQDVLDDWRMELWFDENWRLTADGPDRYLQFYEATWHAVKDCNENIRLGGYGIRMDFGSEERLVFLSRWNKLPYRPDFISVGFYAYERREDGLDRYARRNTDDQALVHYIDREKQLIEQAGMQDLPLMISEWNLTPSVRNYINDTTFKAAYLIKNTIDLYGKVDVAAYCAASDRQYSSFDTPDILFGGTGLLTRDGIMKPAGFAYDFLQRLFPYYLGKGDHYLVTTDHHDNYCIICHNQQVLNYNYYLTDEYKMEKDAMWKYYERRQRLALHIKLDGVTDGLYQVKVYRLNESSGSVLKTWADLDYERELSRNDLKYFRRVCEPGMTIRTQTAEDGDLVIDEVLQPNEITLIRVRYTA